jgi:hypothetical protein
MHLAREVRIGMFLLGVRNALNQSLVKHSTQCAIQRADVELDAFVAQNLDVFEDGVAVLVPRCRAWDIDSVRGR